MFHNQSFKYRLISNENVFLSLSLFLRSESDISYEKVSFMFEIKSMIDVCIFLLHVITKIFLFRSYPLLGYLSQDLLGLNLKDFIHEDDRNRIMDLWNRSNYQKN